MPAEFGTLFALLLLGGAVAIDGTSYGQFMISRPFIAASLAGWIVGAPAQGALIGVVLEALHLQVLPVGAAKYPEGGPAAVAAGAAFALSPGSPTFMLAVIVGAVALEWTGGVSVHVLRLVNVRIVSPGGVAARNLAGRHLAALALDFTRGMILVAVGLLFLWATILTVDRFPVLDDRLASLAVVAGVAAMFASSIRLLNARIWYALAGTAVGLVLLQIGR